MLPVNVIMKLSSRIPADREEEKDETKLSAIWERRAPRTPAALVTEEQMQPCSRGQLELGGGAHLLPWSAERLCCCLKCQLSGLTSTCPWKVGN